MMHFAADPIERLTWSSSDGPGWMRAIRDYAASESVRRADQLSRLAAWRRPGWNERIDTVLAVAQEAAR